MAEAEAVRGAAEGLAGMVIMAPEQHLVASGQIPERVGPEAQGAARDSEVQAAPEEQDRRFSELWAPPVASDFSLIV